MKILRDPGELDALAYEELRDLIAERFDAMADGEPFDADIHGYAVVVETGDTCEQLDEAVDGLLLAGGVLEDAILEHVERHEAWFEVSIVPDAGDFGVLVFVPRESDVDARLLSLCERYAVVMPDE